jgi:hypothetical protein
MVVFRLSGSFQNPDFADRNSLILMDERYSMKALTPHLSYPRLVTLLKIEQDKGFLSLLEYILPVSFHQVQYDV